MKINMNPGYGITSKMLVWFLMVVSIFYGTTLLLYINIQQSVRISNEIVSKNYSISSNSKKMIENLLSMEENEKKYCLLKKNEYLSYYIKAQNLFEDNLIKILHLRSREFSIPSEWDEIYETYRKFPPLSEVNAKYAESLEVEIINPKLIVPEYMINDLIEKIENARIKNELEMINLTKDLKKKGTVSAKQGLLGLGITSIVGLFGIIYLTYTMLGPLRDLIKGIRSISKDRDSTPIDIRSKDEFGELAAAFNEMSSRLRQEEQMRSDFISMLSHEIRTPLTSIRESVNMIGEEVMGPINQRQRKFLEIASSEIGRICELLNHLMQASRLEPGALKVQARPVDPYALVVESVECLKAAAEQKKMKVKISIMPNISDVLGDPKQIQQVILNLLGNAIKFCHPEARIVIRAERDKNPSLIRFSVEDNGPGILEEELDLLFNKYFRGQSVRDHLDGTGLGLSISKNIIEAHSGTIWAESQLGKGSVFRFTLPVVRSKYMNTKHKD